MTDRFGSHTFEDMKDAVVTVRLRAVTRKQLQRVAVREGRSVSAQIERFVEAGLSQQHARNPGVAAGQSLAGIFAGMRVPTLAEMREVRREISHSLTKRAR